jgi:hypothetical protein
VAARVLGLAENLGSVVGEVPKLAAEGVPGSVAEKVPGLAAEEAWAVRLAGRGAVWAAASRR